MRIKGALVGAARQNLRAYRSTQARERMWVVVVAGCVEVEGRFVSLLKSDMCGSSTLLQDSKFNSFALWANSVLNTLLTRDDCVVAQCIRLRTTPEDG